MHPRGKDASQASLERPEIKSPGIESKQARNDRDPITPYQLISFSQLRTAYTLITHSQQSPRSHDADR